MKKRSAKAACFFFNKTNIVTILVLTALLLIVYRFFSDAIFGMLGAWAVVLPSSILEITFLKYNNYRHLCMQLPITVNDKVASVLQNVILTSMLCAVPYVIFLLIYSDGGLFNTLFMVSTFFQMSLYFIDIFFFNLSNKKSPSLCKAASSHGVINFILFLCQIFFFIPQLEKETSLRNSPIPVTISVVLLGIELVLFPMLMKKVKGNIRRFFFLQEE